MTIHLRQAAITGFVALWCTAVWAALWGSAAPGTLLAGALLGTAVAVTFARVGPLPEAGQPIVRPLALLRLAATFAVMLLSSTITVTRIVCAPRLEVAPAVVAVRLPPSTEAVTTIVANAVSLTPGTVTLDAQRDPDGTVRLVIHALDGSDTAVIRQDVLNLHRLTSNAFPRPRTIAENGAAA